MTYFDYQSIVVAFYIENNSIIIQNTCVCFFMAIQIFNCLQISDKVNFPAHT